MEGFNEVKNSNEEASMKERDSEDAMQRSEATDGERQQEINYVVIESDIETYSETQREGLFGDYGYCPPTFKFNPNATQKTTPPKCSNCAMKTHPTLSEARADAYRNRKRTQAITRLRDQEIFLEMIDAPREFAGYNSLGETPLMAAIAYGHEDIVNYIWFSSNVPQIAKDNSTVLHYAARYGNGGLVRAACEETHKINIDQKTIPDN
ncbi:hypothetical protein OUZ56_011952 [Daphnia magna]|uniref:ANK_REP_REGION domain-containing protein n=1 Tax=Daphnia magna TaxID=35525 RepID=A0ABQ9Z1M5_9CRUS|nr:hypothetical protein OUZ56_011952 [Daphnia magna]